MVPARTLLAADAIRAIMIPSRPVRSGNDIRSKEHQPHPTNTNQTDRATSAITYLLPKSDLSNNRDMEICDDDEKIRRWRIRLHDKSSMEA